MGLFLRLLPLLMIPALLPSQDILNYRFVTKSVTYTQVNGSAGSTVPALSGGDLDDGFYNTIPIGFTFKYLGANYTTISAATNGWITFGQLISDAWLNNNLETGGIRPVVAPLWDDLGLGIVGAAFSYKTEGVAPNRVFTAEWLNVAWNFSSSTAAISFQLKLYETSNAIEFIYRQEAGAITSGSASIGITATGTGSGGTYLSLSNTSTSPSVSSTISTNTIATKPATGQVYRFEPSEPQITSVSSFSGSAGASITINGSGFATATVSNAVYFGGVKATVTNASLSSLTVTVPAGADYGPIRVTNLITGLTGSTAQFFMPTYSGGGNITTGAFAAKADSITGGSPEGVAVGDIDGDGKPDVVVANFGSNTVSVFRNTTASGSLTFASKVDLTVGSGPYDVALGDIDGDGKLDIVTGNYSAGTISVLRNQSPVGGISFAPKVDSLAGSEPYSVAIADFNRDGKLDIVAANYSTLTVSVLRNQSSPGSISLQSRVPFASGNGLYPVAVGDIDGDGAADIVVTNQSDNNVSVLRNTSTPSTISFAARVNFVTGTTPGGIGIGDLDADGKLDLVIANRNSNTISLLRNTSSIGAPSFAPKADSTTGSYPASVALGDINGDGKLDVVVTNASSYTLSVFRNTSSGSISLSSRVDFATGIYPWGVIVADLTEDGKPDIGVASSGSNQLSLYRNTIFVPSTLTFQVDARPAMAWGRFNPIRGDSLIVRGDKSPLTFSTNSYVLTDSLPADSLYTVTVTFDTLGSLNFKYAIRHDGFDIWEFDSAGAGGNRLATLSSGSFNLAPVSFSGLPGYQRNVGEYPRSTNTVALIRLNENLSNEQYHVANSGQIMFDYSGRGNHGYLRGTTLQPGRFGNSRGFAGPSDYVEVLHHPSLNVGTGDFTVESWVKFTNTNDQRIVHKLAGAVGYSLWLTNGTARAFIYDGTNTANIQGTRLINDNRWHHVAAVREGTLLKLYVDGIPDGATSASAVGSLSNSDPLILGHTITPGFSGQLDEVRISNIARQPNEFNLQLPPRNLAATPGSGSISLNWQNGGGAVGLLRYRIYRGLDSTSMSQVDSTTLTSYTNTGLTAGTRYFYRVTAVDSTGFESIKSFATSAQPVAFIGEIEPNSTAGQANRIAYGDSVTASIQPSGDVDYFKFTGAAGDTIEFALRNRGTSDLSGFVELYDSASGSYRWGEYSFPGATKRYFVYPITQNGTYYLRYSSFYNSPTSFPNSLQRELQRLGEQQTGFSSESAASPDTGAYGFTLRRFVAGRPVVHDYVYYGLLFWNSITLVSYVNPRGQPTNVTFHYGPTPSLGLSAAAPGPVSNIYTTRVESNPITGLTPSTTYHMRASASNASGSDTSAATASITTPPSPEGWVQKTVPLPGYLFGVSFATSQTGMTVGENGRVFHTTDGGNTWTSRPAPTSDWLWGVWMIDQNTAVIVGDYGVIYRTTNAGISWSMVTNPTTATLWKVKFVNANLGLAVGDNGVILRTLDGGLSWSQVTTGTGQDLRGIHFVDANTAYVVGSGGTLLRTVDGGASWTSVPTGITYGLYAVWFKDANTGFVTGQLSDIRRTTDGGVSWTSVATGAPDYLLDVAFADPTTGLVVGGSGTIVRTNDGGTTWFLEQSGTYNWLRSVDAKNPTWLAVGDWGAMVRKQGPSPEVEPNNTSSGAQPITYGDEVDGVIDPNNDIDYFQFTAAANDTVEIYVKNRAGSDLDGLVELYDAGGTQLKANDDFHYDGFENNDSRIVYAFAQPGTYYIRFRWWATGGTFPNRSDEGSSPKSVRSLQSANLRVADPFWTYRLSLKKVGVQRPAVTTHDPDIYVRSLMSNFALVSGFVYPNGSPTTVTLRWGSSPTSLSNTASILQGTVTGLDINYVTAPMTGLTPLTTYYYRLVASNALGTTEGEIRSITTPPPPEGWAPRIGNTFELLYDVNFPDANTGYAVGRNGTIVKSTNGGVNWTNISSGNGLSNSLFGVWFTNPSTGWISGAGGLIRRTDDGGSLWTTQPTPVTDALRAIKFTDGNNGLAVGGNGVILRTTNGGQTWSQVSSSTTNFLFDVAYAGPQIAVAVGNSGTIVRTTNGGLTWALVTSNTTNQLRRVTFVGPNTGYAVGTFSTILKTTDAGQTWTNQSLADTTFALLGVEFADTARGFVVGISGLIIETKNGGANWNVMSSGTDNLLYSVTLAGASTGVIVGDFGTILRAEAQAPVAPSNLVATVISSTQIELTWTDNSSTEESFRVERKTGAGGTYAEVAQLAPNTTRYLDGGLTTGTEYFYRVKAVNVSGSSLSNEVNATPVSLTIAPPTNLVATVVSDTRIDLSWVDNSDNETGFEVQRKTASTSFTTITTVGAGITTYSNTGLTTGTEYTYRVRAVNATVQSPYSNEASATPTALAVQPPTNLVVTPISATQMTLTWTDNAINENGYQIERRQGITGNYEALPTLPPANTTSYTDGGLSPGTTYFYRVRAFSLTLGNSPYSNEAFGTTLTSPAAPTSMAIAPSGWTNNPSFTITWTNPSHFTGITKAWYTVNSVPSQTNQGTSVNITTPQITVQVTTPGSNTIYVYLEDASTNKNPNAYASVTALYDNDAPVVTHDPNSVGSVTVQNGTVTSALPNISASASQNRTDLSPFGSLTLQYKKTQDGGWTSMAYTGTNGSLQIPASAFTTSGQANGVDYQIIATDQAGNVGKSGPYSIRVTTTPTPVPTADMPPPAQSLPSERFVEAYRIFSVPYDLTDKKPSSFVPQGLGPHNKESINYYNWRMVRIINGGTAEEYETFKDQNVVTPGSAFFLIIRESGKTITPGPGDLVKAQQMAQQGIAVAAGWNLIGNPFLFDFPVDSLTLSAGTIQTRAYYSGTGSTGGWEVNTGNANTIKPWKGVALRVSQSATLKFKAIPGLGTSIEADPPSPPLAIEEAVGTSQGSWMLKFGAFRTDNPMRDSENYIGMTSGAEEGIDRFDWYQPPLVGLKNVALFFRNSDNDLMRDIRPISSDGGVWEMRVKTGDSGARVKLNVTGVETIANPDHYVYLVDLDQKMAHNLRETSSLEISTNNGIRNFRVIVGTKSFVKEQSGGVEIIPSSMRLFANYPNPFNPETIIRYTIPDGLSSYRVSLRIYNIIGQEVMHLVDKEQPAGYYEVKFDGRALTSGTYFYRITVTSESGEAYTDVKKMLLLK
ncbi:MAG TPA: FG-GAP-like repeat-containing protein [Bacteroidota bacterium]|nr:FG-GAP-like repeat-containing protein [Bacteroidota bacterium]